MRERETLREPKACGVRAIGPAGLMQRTFGLATGSLCYLPGRSLNPESLRLGQPVGISWVAKRFPQV